MRSSIIVVISIWWSISFVFYYYFVDMFYSISTWIIVSSSIWLSFFWIYNIVFKFKQFLKTYKVFLFNIFFFHQFFSSIDFISNYIFIIIVKKKKEYIFLSFIQEKSFYQLLYKQLHIYIHIYKKIMKNIYIYMAIFLYIYTIIIMIAVCYFLLFLIHYMHDKINTFIFWRKNIQSIYVYKNIYSNFFTI